MTIAILGATGRIDAAHAALTLVDAQLVDEGSARLVRVTLSGEAALPDPVFKPTGLTIVQHRAASAAEVGVILATETARTGAGTVLDLPVECLADPAVRERIDVPVVVVGPTPLDEHAALAHLRPRRDPARPDADPADAPWLLGYGRGGASAAVAFAETMTALASLHGVRPRTLPVVLPPFGRVEATRLAEGDRTSRTLAAGLRLLAALRAVSGDPGASSVAAEALADALGSDVGLLKETDERDVGLRLRELADEMQAIQDGSAPTDRDLERVPRIEDWKAGTREVRVLTGRVYGHPEIADGRRIVTSDLYASDGAEWARTLSRYYRLGKPARGQTPAGLRRA